MDVENAGVSTIDAPATEGAATNATNSSTNNVVSEQPSTEQREEPNMQVVADNVEVIAHFTLCGLRTEV